jgi:hypothetical protein
MWNFERLSKICSDAAITLAITRGDINPAEFTSKLSEKYLTG